VGFGSYHPTNLWSGTNSSTYLIDLTKNDFTGITENIFSAYNFPHTIGTYLGTFNGEHYIALGSDSYSDKIYLVKKDSSLQMLHEYKMLLIDTVTGWSPVLALTSDHETKTVFAVTNN
jgi:hypothetical protein